MMAGFSDAWVLSFLLLVPLFFYYYQKILKRKKAAALKFSNLSFIKSALGDKAKIRKVNNLFYLSLLALSLFIMGFANPHIPLKHAKKGVNVVLVLDTSGSMQATDYTPSRIEAAKLAAKTLIGSLGNKDYVGIVTFNTGATTTAYLTPHKKRVLEKLESIHASNGQTSIGDGLALGVDMATSIPNKQNVVILLSDGVNNAGAISPQEAVEFAKSKKVKVYSVGLGSNGKVVLGYDFFGNPQYAELDEETLKSIAEQTGGQYFKSVDDKTLKQIYANLGKVIPHEYEETNVKDWFFLAGTLVLLLEIYLRYGGKMVIQ